MLAMETRETLRKFTLRLEKATRGLTMSDTYIKQAFLDKARGIADIKVVLEDGADDLDLIALAEKAQNILASRANKVPARDYNGPARSPARGPTQKGKMVPSGKTHKLNEIAKEEE